MNWPSFTVTRGLSADAVPALDELKEPLRSCALESIARDLEEDEAWFATSWGEARARSILDDRPLSAEADLRECVRLGDEHMYR